MLLIPFVLLTFFPLLGFLVIALLKYEQKTAIRWVALAHLAGYLWHLPVAAGHLQSR